MRRDGEVNRELTPLQLFAAAQRMVGRDALPMRRGDSPTHVSMGLNAISVVLSVETWRDVRGGVKITHRGTRALLFTRPEGATRWVREILLDDLKKLDQPEYMLNWVETDAEYLDRRAYEEMCWRPGNNRYPMDGPGTARTR